MAADKPVLREAGRIGKRGDICQVEPAKLTRGWNYRRAANEWLLRIKDMATLQAMQF